MGVFRNGSTAPVPGWRYGSEHGQADKTANEPVERGRTVYTIKYRPSGGIQTTKLFRNGRSQEVRLPKDFFFDGDEVYVKRASGGVVLLSKNDPWAAIASDPAPQSAAAETIVQVALTHLLDTDICMEAL